MATWENVGKIQGVKGEQGEQGEQGERGLQGLQGLQGESGIVDFSISENGSYIILANGIGICWLQEHDDQAEFDQSNVYNYISMPLSFVDGLYMGGGVLSSNYTGTRTSLAKHQPVIYTNSTRWIVVFDEDAPEIRNDYINRRQYFAIGIVDQ